MKMNIVKTSVSWQITYLRVSVVICLMSTSIAEAYDQQWRPRFHFSRESGSVGDPAGFIRYHDTYRLFLWDQVQSSDLVHWQDAGWPLHGIPSPLSPWNGTVAVDLNNTSGFGSLEQPPMVALYTLHNNETLEENVAISHSADYYNFTYYENNPVVDGDVDTFRDPDLIWHEASGKWVFTIARPEESKVAFYSSTDLKNWQWTTNFFGPKAAVGFWEVPGMIQLPVDGNPNHKKWVLYTGRGPTQVEYFVGDFNGNSFNMDPANDAYLTRGQGLPGVLFADFEQDSWEASDWTVIGDAFGSRPANGPPAYGNLGQRLANSYVNGDWVTGSKLVSPTFTINRNCINFLIGGGNHPGQTCINLVIGDNVVRTYTGFDSDVLKWGGWNVFDLKAQEAHLEIVDDYGGFWGRIYIDQVMFSDVLYNFVRQHANWVDYGWDFYAARCMRDYDNSEQWPVWLAWMCNWDYALDLPVSYLTIPRNLQLISSSKGYQIQQRPLPNLQQLRGSPTKLTPRKIDGQVNLTEFQPSENAYEIEASFNLPPGNNNAQNFGFNLCVGPDQKVVVGYDAQISNTYIDRTQSSAGDYGSTFPGTVTAPCPATDGYVKFHIFMDKSSIEVFVNDGRIVQSALIFPNNEYRNIEIFSLNGPITLKSFTAWPLNTIW